jgi:hypothetical protein
VSGRTRVWILAAVVAVVVAASAGYVLLSRANQARQVAAAPTQATAAPSVAAEGSATSRSNTGSGPRIVFRNTALGKDYGAVASVPLSAPGGARVITTTHCERVFATSDRTLCLASRPGLVTTYTAETWTTDSASRQALPLSGIPSRARLSRDGSHAATTSFVSGDSYAAESFSTRTIISDLTAGTTADLETFALSADGSSVTAVDRNFWGVTFHPDGDTFYVTAAWAGQTHLAKGSISARTLATLRTDAECPSLSPDATRVAYKKRGDRPRGDWRIAVLDLQTGHETMLAENRSIDDQVEWLDDDTIIYGLPGESPAAAQTNVWAVPADGSGAARMLIEKAWSPAVTR